MTPLLIGLRSSLCAAGFVEPVILSGPNPERQALGVVNGDLWRVPADVYAVSSDSVPALGVSGRALMALPSASAGQLKDRMASISRDAVDIFLRARDSGFRSLALAVPEELFFGDLDLAVCVRLILGAADIFWRIYPEEGLNRVVIAVQSPGVTLSF